MGRFINADAYASTGQGLLGNNMFAYCLNNPICYDDCSGYAVTSSFRTIHIGDGNGGFGYSEIIVCPDPLPYTNPDSSAEIATVITASVAVVGFTALTIVTCGASSIAGIALISATATFAAKAVDVGSLQARKSISEGKQGGQIVEDVFGAIYDNGKAIVGLTPVTKAGGIAFNHFLNASVESAFGGKQSLFDTLSSRGGTAVAYTFVAIAWGQTAMSFFHEDPIERANNRGYTLR